MEEKHKQILVPTDFSEVGNCAIQHGIELSRIFKNDLTIVHIIDETTKKVFKDKTHEEAAIQELEKIAKLNIILK